MMTKGMRNGLKVALLVGPLLAGELGAEESWPRFRGPDGTGVAGDQSVPVKFDETTLAWSVDLAGPGTSSPVVWGDSLFLTGEDRYCAHHSPTPHHSQHVSPGSSAPPGAATALRRTR